MSTVRIMPIPTDEARATPDAAAGAKSKKAAKKQRVTDARSNKTVEEAQLVVRRAENNLKQARHELACAKGNKAVGIGIYAPEKWNEMMVKQIRSTFTLYGTFAEEYDFNKPGEADRCERAFYALSEGILRTPPRPFPRLHTPPL